MLNNRIAISIFFFFNGFLYSSWAARLPELCRFYNLSDAVLGTLLFAVSVGALLAMPFSGWLTTRYGSHQVTRFTALLFYMSIPLVGILPNLYLAYAIFVLMGFSTGSLDVAMNGQAVWVERAYDRPIMSSFHALFSIGMALGAGASAIFTHLKWGFTQHFVLVSVLAFAASVWAMQHLVVEQVNTASKSSGEKFQLPIKAIVPLGLIAFCCMTGEGAMSDWSAIFMNKIANQPESFSALAVSVFGAAMTIGRIFGDQLTIFFGRYKMLIISSLLSIFGLALALIFADKWFSMFGFFIIGLGLATVVPIVYSAAGNTPGVEPSVGIAMATSIGYAGFFVGPPTIGFLSEQFGLRLGLCFILLLFVRMFVLVTRRISKNT
jgi:MFS family permease